MTQITAEETASDISRSRLRLSTCLTARHRLVAAVRRMLSALRYRTAIISLWNNAVCSLSCNCKSLGSTMVSTSPVDLVAHFDFEPLDLPVVAGAATVIEIEAEGWTIAHSTIMLHCNTCFSICAHSV